MFLSFVSPAGTAPRFYIRNDILRFLAKLPVPSVSKVDTVSAGITSPRLQAPPSPAKVVSPRPIEKKPVQSTPVHVHATPRSPVAQSNVPSFPSSAALLDAANNHHAAATSAPAVPRSPQPQKKAEEVPAAQAPLSPVKPAPVAQSTPAVASPAPAAAAPASTATSGASSSTAAPARFERKPVAEKPKSKIEQVMHIILSLPPCPYIYITRFVLRFCC